MTAPQIAIMLCTFNGAKYLAEQLRSISRQTFRNFVVIASDDGSTDETLLILEQAAAGYLSGRLRIVEGPRAGVNANFLSVTASAVPPAPFIAYADQDDIWDDDKLERAMSWLSRLDAALPALYGTRTRLIDRYGTAIGHSPTFKRPATFSNALVQNMFGGNTMVFNAAAWFALKQSNPKDVVSHDWWTYIVVAAVGGSIRYETAPSLNYRQHANNLVGANNSWAARLTRARMLREGRFAKWNSTNGKALTKLLPLMPADIRVVFDRFQNARKTRFPSNVIWLLRSGVYRQTWLANIGLWLATLTRRI